jgi:hypothetical protein
MEILAIQEFHQPWSAPSEQFSFVEIKDIPCERKPTTLLTFARGNLHREAFSHRAQSANEHPTFEKFSLQHGALPLISTLFASRGATDQRIDKS